MVGVAAVVDGDGGTLSEVVDGDALVGAVVDGAGTVVGASVLGATTTVEVVARALDPPPGRFEPERPDDPPDDP